MSGGTPQHEVEQDDPNRALKSAYRMGSLAGQQHGQEGRIVDTIPPIIRHDVECPSCYERPEGHLDERWGQRIYHEGPELPATALVDSFTDAWEALSVHVW